MYCRTVTRLWTPTQNQTLIVYLYLLFPSAPLNVTKWAVVKEQLQRYTLYVHALYS